MMRALLQQPGRDGPGPRRDFNGTAPPPPPFPPPPDTGDQIREQWLALLAYTGLGFAGALAALVIILCACFASRGYMARRRLRRQEEEGGSEEGDGTDPVENAWFRAWQTDTEPVHRFRPIKMIERKGVVIQQPANDDRDLMWVGIVPSLTSQDGDTPRSTASHRKSHEPHEQHNNHTHSHSHTARSSLETGAAARSAAGATLPAVSESPTAATAGAAGDVEMACRSQQHHSHEAAGTQVVERVAGNQQGEESAGAEAAGSGSGAGGSASVTGAPQRADGAGVAAGGSAVHARVRHQRYHTETVASIGQGAQVSTPAGS